MTLEQFLHENLDHARNTSQINWRPLLMLIAGPFLIVYFLVKSFDDPKIKLKSKLTTTAIMIFIGLLGGVSMMRIGWFTDMNPYIEFGLSAIIFGYIMTTIITLGSLGAPDSRYRKKRFSPLSSRR